jgi:hypothetical protein
MSQCELVSEISEDIAKFDLVHGRKMDKAESSSKNSFTLGVGGVGCRVRVDAGDIVTIRTVETAFESVQK